MRFIVTGDNHGRKDSPTCWVGSDEEWLDAQYKCFKAIADASHVHEADVIFTGDVFDTPRVAAEIVAIFIGTMMNAYGKVYVIAGNHSLPYHREANVAESSMGIIKALGEDSKIVYCPCNEESIDGRFEHSYKLSDYVTIVHTLSFPDEDSIPYGCTAVTPKYLLDKYDTPWIFTGDYHGTYVHRDNDRWVVNPGKMLAQTVREIDSPGCIYYVDTGEMTDVTVAKDPKPVYRVTGWKCETITLPSFPDKVSKEHITMKKERDESIESAIALLKEMGDSFSLDFVMNLMVYMEKNPTDSGVKAIIDEIKENNGE